MAIVMITDAQLAIVADDLTGAMDTGVHFLAGDHRPLVRVGSSGQVHGMPAPAGDVLVIDTETRLLGPGDAYARVHEATLGLLSEGYRSFYKKIDSTYRGNVGAEIDAMLDVLECPAAAVVSAVPSAGRTVRDGICFVRGIPLLESESGTDHELPHATSSVRDIVSAQSVRTSVVVTRGHAPGDPATLASELTRHVERGAEILLIDATDNADIRFATEALRLLPERLLLVGAAGLARALSATAPRTSRGSGRHDHTAGTRESGVTWVLGDGPALFVAGSVMPTSMAQADRLAGRTDRVGTIVLRTDAAARHPAAELSRITTNAAAFVRSGLHVLLRTAAVAIAPRRGARDVGRFVGRCAREIVDLCRVDTLVLSGGSTAVAVIEALGVTEMRISGELDPGLPVCEAGIAGSDQCYRIVTKAGGFGGVDAYERIVDRMDRARANGRTAE